ncbi:MAG: hypothetical protein M0Q43_00565 [Methanothrix sp.]|jgi:hypothetical protein|uniref:hypothetical protein n=1 Tax=Methanothrix sp. TaxID=90426 RepID=UPI0025FD09EF|nr:hypothetical protein [Methanothrix sp.]MCK9404979.1 hypothetical protein [Methanothrix sp.]MCK9564522.1 hypothetical protein [Methanothrix sp.]
MQLLAEPALQDRVSSLESIIALQGEKIAALEATASHQEENLLIQLQLIKQLREAIKREPQPMQKDRADILRSLLVANGGKMLAKDARQKMHIKKNHFAELLRVCDFIDTKPYHLDRRQTVIILKSELVPWD